jgi:DNA ligase (NAD+)
VHTIGPVIAHEVVAGLAAKRKLIEKLRRHVEVQTEEPRRRVGPLGGKSFLFTGKLLAMERSDAQKLVEEQGGAAAQSVTKELDFLVVGDGGGAGSKFVKAEKLASAGGKVRVIAEKEFLKMVGKKS